jgi:hypothetical protein
MPVPSLRERFLAFITERQPFAAAFAASVWDRVVKKDPQSADDVEKLRVPFARALRSATAWPKLPAGIETTPAVTARERLALAEDEIAALCDGFFRRESIERSLTPEERLEILRGMILTRAIDNRLKAFFNGSEVRHNGVPFQGKGFDRSVRRLSTRPRFASSAARRSVAPMARGKATSSRRSFATLARRSRCGRRRRRSGWCFPRRWPRPGRPWTGATFTSVTSTGGFFRRRRRSRSAA